MRMLKEWIHEIHRRSLWQVLGVYLAGSWLALQVVEQLVEAAGLPDWVRPFSLVLLILGLPIVLATAIVQEGVGSGGEGPTSSARGGGDDGRDAGALQGAGPGASPSVDPGAPARTPGDAPAPVSVSGGSRTRHALFTWRNAILGGVGAFALLGLLTVGWVVSRSLGVGPAASLVAAGVLDERSRIVLAEFESRTGDEELAGSVTELLRVDLSQSQLVRLVEPAFVASVLGRMERPTDTPLDPDLAREIAVREGVPAVISGEVNAAGSSYALSARLLTSDGQELAAFRETAEEEGDVIAAVDRLSKEMRAKMGESLRTIRAEQPLERATTASLEALRKYTQGVRATEVENDEERAIALLEEAVALDSAFAMAWRKLGVVLLNNAVDRSRWMRAFRTAYEHRDRLTDRERYITEGTYFNAVTNEPERAITAYENLLALYPDGKGALNNLANLVWDRGDVERAASLYARALEADSSVVFFYANLTAALAAAGRLEEAEAVVATLTGRVPEDHVQLRWAEASVAEARGDYDAVADAVDRVRTEQATALWRAGANFALGALAALRGRIEEGETLNRRAAAADAGADRPANALVDLLQVARRRALLLGDEAGAVAILEEATDRFPLTSMPPLDRPYAELADAWAVVGRPERARALLAAYREAVDSLYRGPDREVVARAEANIAAAEGRYEETLRRMPDSDPRFCVNCALPARARAFDLAGRPDSAVAAYERYLARPAAFAFWGEDEMRAPAHERLARLYEERGDLEDAARHYAAFLELWAEADPELQPRVEAARARLEAILAERG